MTLNKRGKVFILGAGVGGVEYLTRRAYDLLTQAEVLIYDALVDPSLLNLASINCDRLSVGKRGGQPSTSQAEIDQLLVKFASQGKMVIRLKSGDPIVFGRALSELQSLHTAGYDFELVPGISSAIAAPLFAGIPLTDALLSPCFTVLTGHDLESIPWNALAKIPTLVILMGTTNLAQILDRLDKPSHTAIAIIQWCGSPQQQVWTGTLADIQARIPQERSLSPSVIVIGEVVKQAEWIAPHLSRSNLPLTGKNILVTRAAGQSSSFSQMLIEQGARVIEMPTLAILPPDSWQPLDQAIANLEIYQWLILTSANAVENFFARLHFAQKDSRALHSLKVAVVGKKTAASLSSYGVTADLIPPDFIADALVECFSEIEGARILFPRVQSGGREILIEQLEKRGAIVEAIAAYESGCPLEIDAHALQSLQNQSLNLITFASSKTVKHFGQLLNQVAAPTTWQAWLANVKIASIGPQTSTACHQLLGRVDCEAKEYTLSGLTAAIALLFN